METKKSVLNEAIIEFNELMEAAQKKAKDDMAKEFPEKFNKTINEYVEKLSKMKDDIKNNKKNIYEEKANNIKDETFKEPAKTKKSEEMGKTKDAETRKDMGKGVDSKVEKTYTEEPKKNKKVNESTEDDVIDLTDFSMEELEEAFDNANNDDEFNINDDEELEIDLDDSDVDLEDIENEISKMDSMSEEFEVDENKNDPYTKLKQLQEEMNQIIDSINNSNNNDDDTIIQEFDEKISGVYGENYRDVLGSDYEKMLDLYKNQKESKPQHFYDNKDTEITVEDNEFKETNNGEESVEEAHGISLANNKNVGSNTQPRPDYAEYKKNKLRYALQKEQYEKRINSLVIENKNNKIKYNKLKNKTDETNKLLESYREVIKKYRDRLNEMVVFNTNLAHTNNLFINENFNLSFEEKKDIIEKFKSVNSIDESENLYKKILNEKSNLNNKNSINEFIEKKYNNVIYPSSKQKIGETVEKSAYQNDEHVSKIKRLIEYNPDKNK